MDDNREAFVTVRVDEVLKKGQSKEDFLIKRAEAIAKRRSTLKKRESVGYNETVML